MLLMYTNNNNECTAKNTNRKQQNNLYTDKNSNVVNDAKDE